MLHASRSTFATIGLLASIFLLLGSHTTVIAQSTAVAQVSGTVTDPSGAAIVSA
jgi:hypothetical protein